MVRPEIVVIEPPQPQTGRHRAEARSWLGLADRVLHSWPITLRLALLLLIVLAGVAGAAAALGVFGR